MSDMLGRRVSFDPGDPPDRSGWDNDYCANLACKKPYDPELIDLLESGYDQPPPWPFCSVVCQEATQEAEAEAEEALAKQMLDEFYFVEG